MAQEKTIIVCSFCDKHMDGTCWKDRLHGYDSWCSLECIISDNNRDNIRRIESLLETINHLLKVLKHKQNQSYSNCKDCHNYYIDNEG